MAIKKHKMGRKAQFKIQQMMFMLMAIVLFFVLAGLFFIAVKFSDLNKQSRQLSQEKAISLALSLASSPEITCGEGCVDFDKIMVLKGREIFASLWPVSEIQVRKIYPPVAGHEKEELECTVTNYPQCNLVTIYSNSKDYEKATASSFVRLCRKEDSEGYNYEKCELGEIIVRI